MTPSQVLQDTYDQFEEYLEMMTIEEKFILIKNVLAQKLAYEMMLKDHYKTCFEKAISTPTWRINS